MKTIFTTATVAALFVPVAGGAQDFEASANVGWSSEYFYRGVPQEVSSASAGFDLGAEGAYVGTWAADVAPGMEIDVYGGYTVDVRGFSLSAGGTGYFYTNDRFDRTYLEANFGTGYGPLGVELSIGTHDADPDDETYWFLAATLEEGGAYGRFGTFGNDLEGKYGEAGYGFTVMELDLTISWIYSTAAILGAAADDHTLIFGVEKTFSLR